MRLALLNPESYFGDPPLGLGYIAGYLKKYSKIPVEIAIFDKQNLIAGLKKFNPDVIGCSAVSETFYAANELAKKIKEEIKVPLFLGGLHVTLAPHDFKDSNFDIAVLGEAEKTVLEIVENFEAIKRYDIKTLKKINGLLFRDPKTKEVIYSPPREQIQNLDEIPFPDRELLNMRFYLQPRPGTNHSLQVRASMMTSRGCPYSCGFCATTVFWKNNKGINTIRYHSPEYVAKETKMLVEKYGVEHIFIFDDLFMVDKQRVKDIVTALEKEGIKRRVEFSIQARANLITKEMANDLKEMGVKQLIFGFESGSDRVLKTIKGPSVSSKVNAEAIKNCKEVGIEVQGLFIIGSPGEKEEDLQQTYDFIKNNNLDYAMIYQGYPFPGTDWFKYAVESDIVKKDYYTQPHDRLWLGHDYERLLTKDIPLEEFKKWVKKFDELQQTFEKNIKVHYWKYKNFKYFFRPRFIKRYLRSYTSRFIVNNRTKIEKIKNALKKKENQIIVEPTVN